MSIKINHGLNPVYETIFLLYFGYDMDKYKSNVISQINGTGNNGEEIYQKHFKIIDKYVEAFQNFRISCEKDRFYFLDTSMDFYLSFVTPFFLNKNFINDVGEMDNDRIFQIILQNSGEILEQDVSEYSNLSHTEFIKTDTLMEFINRFDLSDNEKWKMLLIFQNPADYYLCFADLIKKNIPAFEKSIKTIKTALDKHLIKFSKLFSKEEEDNIEILDNFDLSKCDIYELTPTMVTASTVIIVADNCFFGLMAEKALAELGFKTAGKEYLLICLKALSDNSKLEILSTLKISPKYAAELAALLGLTPATVSHHMNALLSANMVYVEKSGGKYYFHLNENVINEILVQLRSLLL